MTFDVGINFNIHDKAFIVGTIFTKLTAYIGR